MRIPSLPELPATTHRYVPWMIAGAIALAYSLAHFPFVPVLGVLVILFGLYAGCRVGSDWAHPEDFKMAGYFFVSLAGGLVVYWGLK